MREEGNGKARGNGDLNYVEGRVLVKKLVKRKWIRVRERGEELDLFKVWREKVSLDKGRIGFGGI